jgi:hypothetical protein
MHAATNVSLDRLCGFYAMAPKIYAIASALPDLLGAGLPTRRRHPMTALLGVPILLAGFAILWAFRSKPGTPQWVEISVAMIATIAISLGAILAIAGVGGFFFS